MGPNEIAAAFSACLHENDAGRGHRVCFENAHLTRLINSMPVSTFMLDCFVADSSDPKGENEKRFRYAIGSHQGKARFVGARACVTKIHLYLYLTRYSVPRNKRSPACVRQRGRIKSRSISVSIRSSQTQRRIASAHHVWNSASHQLASRSSDKYKLHSLLSNE